MREDRMTSVRPRRSPRVATCGAFLAVVTLALSACRPSAPHTEKSQVSVRSSGTIRGTVRGAEGANTLADRVVEVVNVDTGERQRTTTSPSGGFSFNVKPAKYRVEVALNGGESLIARPGVIDLSRKSVDASADFVVRSDRGTRPRHTPHPADTGLGPPIV
jgi:Carboxypeptidase regulatory-like domain